MIRVVKIADITLDNTLFINESYEPKNVKAVSFGTLGGSKIVYESARRDNANDLTLESLDNGWQREETLNKIVELANILGESVDLTTADGGVVGARFKHEESKIITASMLYEGSDWYKVTIKMAYL